MKNDGQALRRKGVEVMAVAALGSHNVGPFAASEDNGGPPGS
jgi:hypothetical protein